METRILLMKKLRNVLEEVKIAKQRSKEVLKAKFENQFNWIEDLIHEHIPKGKNYFFLESYLKDQELYTKRLKPLFIREDKLKFIYKYLKKSKKRLGIKKIEKKIDDKSGKLKDLCIELKINQDIQQVIINNLIIKIDALIEKCVNQGSRSVTVGVERVDELRTVNVFPNLESKKAVIKHYKKKGFRVRECNYREIVISW